MPFACELLQAIAGRWTVPLTTGRVSSPVRGPASLLCRWRSVPPIDSWRVRHLRAAFLTSPQMPFGSHMKNENHEKTKCSDSAGPGGFRGRTSEETAWDHWTALGAEEGVNPKRPRERMTGHDQYQNQNQNQNQPHSVSPTPSSACLAPGILLHVRR